MNPEDYNELIEEYKTIRKKIDDGEAETGEDAIIDIMHTLIEENDFINILDSETADEIIKNLQQSYLDTNGGWPIYDDKSFSASKDGEKYVVLCFGVSDGGNEKPLILGMLFVK